MLTCVVLSLSVTMLVPSSPPNVMFAVFSNEPSAVMFHESMVLFTTSTPSSDRVLLFMKVRFLPMENVRLLTFKSGSTSSVDDPLPKPGYVSVAFIDSVSFITPAIVVVMETSVTVST